MSYFFIINPTAGKGWKESVPVIHSLLRNRKKRYEIAFTNARGHASELAVRAMLDGFRTIVAVGGDGTARETATSLVGRDAVLGIIPCGSGNGLARNLYIPLDPVAACRGMLEWGERRIDVGLANGRPFFCTAGFGLDAEVAKIFNKRKGRRGILPYVFYSFYRFFRQVPRRMVLNIKEERFEFKPMVLTVANGREYGGGAKIAPAALLDDGILNVTMVGSVSLLKGICKLHTLFNGTIDTLKEVRTFTCRNADVSCEKGTLFHLDGEDEEIEENVRFSILPGRLRVKAPRP